MDAKVLDILENCFEWNRDRKLIRKIRKEVEDFERWTEMKAAEMLRAKRQQQSISFISYYAIYKADKIFKKKYFISFQIMNYYITYIKKCISI